MIFPPFDFYTDIQDVLRMFCNYKLNHCKFRKKNKILCLKNICEKCQNIKNINLNHINNCDTCKFICEKCKLSQRLCQSSFFEIYKCYNHNYVRNFVKSCLINNNNFFKI